MLKERDIDIHDFGSEAADMPEAADCLSISFAWGP